MQELQQSPVPQSTGFGLWVVLTLLLIALFGVALLFAVAP